MATNPKATSAASTPASTETEAVMLSLYRLGGHLKTGQRRVIALTPELTSWFSGLSLAGFEVTLYGRFWVTPEGEAHSGKWTFVAAMVACMAEYEQTEQAILYPRFITAFSHCLENSASIA